MAEPRRTLRCPDRIWRGAKHHATHHGDTLSEVLRAALSAYLRDRDGFWVAVTPASTDGPSQPAFSHAQARVKPWRWDRPCGHVR